MTSAFLSGAICGVGGVMYGITVGNFEPGDAFKLLLPSFAVIVLGTIGSIRGAIVAAIVIGCGYLGWQASRQKTFTVPPDHLGLHFFGPEAKFVYRPS